MLVKTTSSKLLIPGKEKNGGKIEGTDRPGSRRVLDLG